MFTVKIGKSTQKFDTWEAARTYAEKESWLQAKPARIYSNQGMAYVEVP